jgi:hypothetical protein
MKTFRDFRGVRAAFHRFAMSLLAAFAILLLTLPTGAISRELEGYKFYDWPVSEEEFNPCSETAPRMKGEERRNALDECSLRLQMGRAMADFFVQLNQTFASTSSSDVSTSATNLDEHCAPPWVSTMGIVVSVRSGHRSGALLQGSAFSPKHVPA